jgi:hypothetical protein
MVDTLGENMTRQRKLSAVMCRNATRSRAGIAAFEAGRVRTHRNPSAHDPGGGPGN